MDICTTLFKKSKTLVTSIVRSEAYASLSHISPETHVHQKLLDMNHFLSIFSQNLNTSMYIYNRCCYGSTTPLYGQVVGRKGNYER